MDKHHMPEIALRADNSWQVCGPLGSESTLAFHCSTLMLEHTVQSTERPGTGPPLPYTIHHGTGVQKQKHEAFGFYSVGSSVAQFLSLYPLQIKPGREQGADVIC